MRILRLDLADEFHSLDLHPLVSVVSGLAPPEQRALFDAVRSLASGSTAGVRGLIQHDSMLTELRGAQMHSLSEALTAADVIAYIGLESGTSQLVGLTAEIDQWQRQAAIDAVTVEEIRADVDPSLPAQVAKLKRILDPMLIEPTEMSSASAVQVRYMAVHRALTDLLSHRRHTTQADPGLVELIGRWDTYVAGRASNATHIEELNQELSANQEIVRSAHQMLGAAELAAKPVLLTREEEARLESLSDEPEDGGWLKRGRSSEEEAELQGLLDKVGVGSWTAYTMYRVSPAPLPEKQAEVDRAREDLLVATQNLDQVKRRIATDEVAVGLDVSHQEILREAQGLLGALVPSDIGAALRGLIDQEENAEWSTAFNVLRDVLASHDLRPPYGHEPDQVVAWTQSWMEAEALQYRSATDAAGPMTAEETDELERELAKAEALLLRHRRAMTRMGRAKQAAMDSQKHLEGLQDQLTNQTSLPEPTTASEVLAVVTQVIRGVRADFAGSVPLVISGELARLNGSEIEALMEGLEAAAQHVQIIVVTGRPEVAQWAAKAGLERALHSNGVKVLV